MLAGVASANKQIPRVGSSIINIYSRSPATIAMGAATVDTISNGRLILGLGASSVPIVEDFHGYKFQSPIKRMREYVQIIRLLLSGAKADYAGQFFDLKGFGLLIKPVRKHLPIYLAAVNTRMVNLAWEVADGVIFYLRPINELKETIRMMRSSSERQISTTCQIITCVAHDSEAARIRAKKTIAFYVSVGRVYRQFLADNGFAKETSQIFNEFKKTGFESSHLLVPDAMLDSLAIAGTPEECRGQLAKFRGTGMDLPIIQFNPVDSDVHGSFELLCKTFFSQGQ